jgi:hypothetical protein
MDGSQVADLAEAVRADPVVDLLLSRLAASGPPEWYVGAGAVAAAVWNRRFGKPPGCGVKDYDVVYFDPGDLGEEAEARVRATIAGWVPASVELDVTNEARVHLWYHEAFGRRIEPYRSIEAAIATWPTTATSIGVRLDGGGGAFSVCAPFGLDDLFAGVVRPNTALVSREVYEAKVARWRQVWPELTILPW